MDIEVAVPQEYTTKQRGDLLEELTADFMRVQGYEVEREVRITASELDLLCKHKINKKTVYVECKAYRETLSAKILNQLLGTVVSNNYQEGWLISTGPLGKDAKGFKSNWEEKPTSESQRLSIYTPERVINALINANLIKPQPQEKAKDLLKNEELLGSWVLLVTPYGRYSGNAFGRQSTTPNRRWRTRTSVHIMRSSGRKQTGSHSVWRSLISSRGRICWKANN